MSNPPTKKPGCQQPLADDGLIYTVLCLGVDHLFLTMPDANLSKSTGYQRMGHPPRRGSPARRNDTSSIKSRAPARKLYQRVHSVSIIESQFAIDSTGFSGCRFDRWYEEKYDGEKVACKEHTNFRLMAEKVDSDVAMKNEVLCKLLAHNICCLIQEQYELGIEPVLWQDEQVEKPIIAGAKQAAQDDCYALAPMN